ncbi:MAG: 30S ribosome-binding factor RbfA [Oscillospiraceae bacterium]|jgi:ribosome-binding factor A|nr:30S ribosome-binding factor RbfA [Oscillospiraceae bacterium]MCI9364647.1 30S ribosome-binding factor RbfA [Oscillospiraceae bacterium]MCI9668475.1 30S ribosome-binding factor RbfA [Oscillospiraceae bacterium]RKJ57114.1 30S ribosome-binding factor RbfA [bacterium 1XD42-8]RKJ66240.1 30S ribosome-binding factor RbfA [bacterium 1XD42-1]
MGSYRASRTEEDIKRELSDIIRSLKDPRISGLISIVKLDLSHDMSYCKVYISAMEGMEAAKNAVKGLQSAAGFIKRELNLRMKLRRLPEFKFIADDSIAYSAGIAKMLRDLDE